MSISKRVQEALTKIGDNDFEAAFIPACIAIDATAHLEHPTKRVNERYKTFLHDYLWVIGLVGFDGIVARNIIIPSSPIHPDLKPDANGMCAIEDVLYTVIRCGIIHEADISSYVKIDPDIIMDFDGDKYIFAQTLPLGLTVAAMLSPENVNERLKQSFTIEVGRRSFDANALWGQRNAISSLLQSRQK